MKTVVITGANRGIGLAMTSQFKTLGFDVIALCRQSSSELAALNVRVIEGVDVGTSVGREQMVNQLANVTIDILINNAGILRDESLGTLNEDTIMAQFAINALAPLQVVDLLANQLQSGSKVALITSRMGSISDNGSGGRYGYFFLPALENKMCRFFSLCYNIYKATWRESEWLRRNHFVLT